MDLLRSIFDPTNDPYSFMVSIVRVESVHWQANDEEAAINNDLSESHTFRTLPILRYRNRYTGLRNANPCYQTFWYVYTYQGMIGAVMIGII